MDFREECYHTWPSQLEDKEKLERTIVGIHSYLDNRYVRTVRAV